MLMFPSVECSQVYTVPVTPSASHHNLFHMVFGLACDCFLHLASAFLLELEKKLRFMMPGLPQ